MNEHSENLRIHPKLQNKEQEEIEFSHPTRPIPNMGSQIIKKKQERVEIQHHFFQPLPKIELSPQESSNANDALVVKPDDEGKFNQLLIGDKVIGFSLPKGEYSSASESSDG